MVVTGRFLACRGGTSAVEFAVIAPVFILMLLTLCAYGIYLGTAHSIQQIAADAARIAVAGLDAGERASLAGSYIDQATLAYPFIEKAHLQVAVQDDALPGQFTVRLSYDAARLPIWNLVTFPLPSTEISRFSTIRVGGV
jgi:Flp pilus assembly protein TadG